VGLQGAQVKIGYVTNRYGHHQLRQPTVLGGLGPWRRPPSYDRSQTSPLRIPHIQTNTAPLTGLDNPRIRGTGTLSRSLGNPVTQSAPKGRRFIPLKSALRDISFCFGALGDISSILSTRRDHFISFYSTRRDRFIFHSVDGAQLVGWTVYSMALFWGCEPMLFQESASKNAVLVRG